MDPQPPISQPPVNNPAPINQPPTFQPPVNNPTPINQSPTFQPPVNNPTPINQSPVNSPVANPPVINPTANLTSKTLPEGFGAQWRRTKCANCNYVYEGSKTLKQCPKCGNTDPDKFLEVD